LITSKAAATITSTTVATQNPPATFALTSRA
jgi:hypothetical protein